MDPVTLTLMIWLISIILTQGIQIQTAMNVVKIFAINGYKIKFDKIKELAACINQDRKKKNAINKFIPVYNMIIAINDSLKLQTNISTLLTTMNVLDCLEELTEEEKDEYAKISSPWKILFRQIERFNEDNRLENKVILIDYDSSRNLVQYTEDASGKITILKATKPFSELSDEEQMHILLDTIQRGKQANIEEENINHEETLKNDKPEESTKESNKLSNEQLISLLNDYKKRIENENQREESNEKEFTIKKK